MPDTHLARGAVAADDGVTDILTHRIAGGSDLGAVFEVSGAQSKTPSPEAGGLSQHGETDLDQQCVDPLRKK